MTRHLIMIPLLVAAIAMALTLPTWAAVLQASIAGAALGARLVMIAVDRNDRKIEALRAWLAMEQQHADE